MSAPENQVHQDSAQCSLLNQSKNKPRTVQTRRIGFFSTLAACSKRKSFIEFDRLSMQKRAYRHPYAHRERMGAVSRFAMATCADFVFFGYARTSTDIRVSSGETGTNICFPLEERSDESYDIAYSSCFTVAGQQ